MCNLRSRSREPLLRTDADGQSGGYGSCANGAASLAEQAAESQQPSSSAVVTDVAPGNGNDEGQPPSPFVEYESDDEPVTLTGCCSGKCLRPYFVVGVTLFTVGALVVIAKLWESDYKESDGDATPQLMSAGALHELAYALNTLSLIFYGDGLIALDWVNNLWSRTSWGMHRVFCVVSVASSVTAWALVLKLGHGSNRGSTGTALFDVDLGTHFFRFISVFYPVGYLMAMRAPLDKRCADALVAVKAKWPTSTRPQPGNVPWAAEQLTSLRLTTLFVRCRLPLGVRALVAWNAFATVAASVDMWVDLFGGPRPLPFLTYTMITTCVHIGIASVMSWVVHFQTLYLFGRVADEVEASQRIFPGW